VFSGTFIGMVECNEAEFKMILEKQCKKV